MEIAMKFPEAYIQKQWTDFIHLNRPYTVIVVAEVRNESVEIATIPMVIKISFEDLSLRFIRKIVPTLEPPVSTVIDFEETISKILIEPSGKDLMIQICR